MQWPRGSRRPFPEVRACPLGAHLCPRVPTREAGCIPGKGSGSTCRRGREGFRVGIGCPGNTRWLGKEAVARDVWKRALWLSRSCVPATPPSALSGHGPRLLHPIGCLWCRGCSWQLPRVSPPSGPHGLQSLPLPHPEHRVCAHACGHLSRTRVPHDPQQHQHWAAPVLLPAEADSD